MGIELELAVLLIITNVGMIVFGRFEVERPIWRGLLKWALIIGATLGLTQAIGHWALLLPAAALLAGAAVHLTWCRRHGIHPLHATPRRRYYELRGWDWPS